MTFFIKGGRRNQNFSCIFNSQYKCKNGLVLTVYLIKTHFNAFANRADPDQAAA